jgi:hypothetical protein
MKTTTIRRINSFILVVASIYMILRFILWNLLNFITNASLPKGMLMDALLLICSLAFTILFFDWKARK